MQTAPLRARVAGLVGGAQGRPGTSRPAISFISLRLIVPSPNRIAQFSIDGERRERLAS